MHDLAESCTSLWPETATALANVRTGERSQAARVGADLAEEAGASFVLGVIHGALGELDEAFASFSAAAPMGWPETLFFRYPPPGVLDRVVDDPRYGRLLEELDRSWGSSPESTCAGAADAAPTAPARSPPSAPA